MALTMLLLIACSSNHDSPGGDTGPGFGDDSDSATDSTVPNDSGSAADDDHDDDGWAADVDCDDTDPNVHPEADEHCLNGIDDDCNAVVDHCDLCTQIVAASEYDWTGWSYGGVEMLETSDQTAVWALGASADGHKGNYAVGLRADAPLPATVIELDDGTVPRALATRTDMNGDGIDDLVIAGSVDVDHSAGWIFSSPISDGSIDADQADASFVGGPDGSWAWVTSLSALAVSSTDPADGVFVGDGLGGWIVPGPLSGAIDLYDDPRVLPVADHPSDAATTDLDGDGTRDLLIGEADASETKRAHDWAIRVFFGPLPAASLDDGNADHSWVDLDAVGYQLATGDFDGDGRGDVFAGSGGCLTKDECRLFLLTQDSTKGSLNEAAAATVLGTVPFLMGSIESADFDLDGVSDLVVDEWYHWSEGPGAEHHADSRVSVLLGPFADGESLFDDANARVSLCKEAESLAGDVTTGDYDRDGMPDIATWSVLFTENFESSRGGMVQIMPSTLFVEP